MINQVGITNEYILGKFNSGMHYIMLDSKSVKALTKNDNKRVVCKLNSSIKFHCAILHKKEGGHFIQINSTICKKLQIKEGSKLVVNLSIDQSKYQFEMPEELEEVLNTDPDADEIFHSLTMGNQRGLIHLVAQLKTSQRRIDRALMIVDKLKKGVTSPKTILK